MKRSKERFSLPVAVDEQRVRVGHSEHPADLGEVNEKRRQHLRQRRRHPRGVPLEDKRPWTAVVRWRSLLVEDSTAPHVRERRV